MLGKAMGRRSEGSAVAAEILSWQRAFSESDNRVVSTNVIAQSVANKGFDDLLSLGVTFTVERPDGSLSESGFELFARAAPSITSRIGFKDSIVPEGEVFPPSRGDYAPDEGLKNEKPHPASTDQSSADPSRVKDWEMTGALSSRAMGPLFYGRMRDYALAWAKSSLNPVYGDAGNNCTNFVSQAIQAGGWKPFHDGGYLDRASLKTWTYNMSGPYSFSYTWSRASYNERFLRLTAGKRNLTNIWNATVGDILYTDWDPNLKAGGTIDHAMIVTDRVSGQPYISQQSPWRKNIPLKVTISNAVSQGRVVVWYGIVT